MNFPRRPFRSKLHSYVLKLLLKHVVSILCYFSPHYCAYINKNSHGRFDCCILYVLIIKYSILRFYRTNWSRCDENCGLNELFAFMLSWWPHNCSLFVQIHTKAHNIFLLCIFIVKYSVWIFYDTHFAQKNIISMY